MTQTSRSVRIDRLHICALTPPDVSVKSLNRQDQNWGNAMRNSAKHFLAIGLMTSVCGLAFQAQAQSAPVDDGATLEEVVVTASKRTENLRDVAQSVTALGDKTLTREGLSYFSDYVAKVPGLNFIQTSPQYSQLILRGISTGTAAPNASVATYVDEAPYGFSSPTGIGALMSPNIDAFDMQRIEVLRGPQGTLYGSNALGGLLKYVTKAPNPAAFSGVIEGGLVSTDGETGWDIHGAVNVPLSDKAALRITAYHVDRPGYIDNPLRGTENTNDFESNGMRAAVLIQATEDLTLRFSGLYQETETGDQGSMDVARVTLKPIYKDLSHARLVDAPGSNTNQLFNFTADWKLGFASLVSSTSYAKTNTDLNFDVSGSYTPYLFLFFGQLYGAANSGKIEDTKFTHEMRLTSTSDGPLSWQVGGFFTHEEFDNVQSLQPVDMTTQVVVPGVLGPLADSHESGTYEEIAAFGGLGYKITPTFDVNVGIRLSQIDIDYNQMTAGAFLGPNDFNRKSSEDVFTYSADARWHITDQTMLYARVAKGYQPGGPNRIAPLVGATPSYDAATTLNYEVGLKGRFFDNRVGVEVTAFRIDWDDIQLAAVVGGFYAYSNGGKASSTGVEWNVDYVPVRGLTLGFNGAYDDAKIEDDTPPSLGGLAGDALPYIPKWSASATVDYEWTLTGDFTGFVGASWRYTGKRESDFTDRTRLPSHDVFDLRAGIENNTWTLLAYVKNVSDERVINSILPISFTIPGGPLEAIVGPPRSYGVTLTARF
jgi:iron complex outermembrane receptor protein